MIFETTDAIVEAANNFGDTREGAGAGPLALAVVALLAIATILLWRNMTNRIKRLPASFQNDSSLHTEEKVEEKPSADER